MSRTAPMYSRVVLDLSFEAIRQGSCTKSWRS